MNEENVIKHQIKELEEIISRLPPGNFFCVQNGSYFKWFKSNGANPLYIPKKNRKNAEELAARKYYTLKLTELKSKLNLIQQFENRISKISDAKYKTLIESPGYNELICSFFHRLPPDQTSWLNEDYDRNTKYPENLRYKTLAGHFVRSKSEVIIANALFTNGIPYRYECALNLDICTVYPDFTIMHPTTRKIYYWEHFGMMDDPKYVDNAFDKMKLYSHKGIYPTINLITTFESLNYPIDSGEIQEKVCQLFL